MSFCTKNTRKFFITKEKIFLRNKNSFCESMMRSKVLGTKTKKFLEGNFYYTKIFV